MRLGEEVGRVTIQGGWGAESLVRECVDGGGVGGSGGRDLGVQRIIYIFLKTSPSWEAGDTALSGRWR